MGTTIAVGVDGSTPGRIALRWAMRHAEDTSAEVVVVYVVGTDLAAIASRSDEEIQADAERIVAAEAQFAQTLAPSVPVTTLVLRGNPMRELISVSKTVDLVVVGTHKTGFIRGRIFGSRSIVLAAGSRTPVAVIPESSGRRRHGIIVGVDDSPAGREAIHFGAIEAARTGETLRLVSAWPQAEGDHAHTHRDNDERVASEVRDMLDREAASVREQFPTVEVHGRVIRLPAAEALVDASASSALVVLGNSGPLSEGQGLLGSVAHDVLLNLAGPTVVVHAADSARG
ncbi:MAG TPA: universal stress protein [Glaciihabitans sp.]|jgi:nucleotide-binding universal stress UspA family protein|nr:universal stress protein [Glaciihabitans sp.]